jgi:hypothetical protein
MFKAEYVIMWRETQTRNYSKKKIITSLVNYFKKDNLKFGETMSQCISVEEVFEIGSL